MSGAIQYLIPQYCLTWICCVTLWRFQFTGKGVHCVFSYLYTYVVLVVHNRVMGVYTCYVTATDLYSNSNYTCVTRGKQNIIHYSRRNNKRSLNTIIQCNIYMYINHYYTFYDVATNGV